MVREFRSMFAFVAGMIAAAFSYGGALVQLVTEALTFDWHLDAHASITLDSAVRDAGRGPSTALQRAKAFLQRALNHPWWITDHFDPGRSAASTA